MLKLITQSCPPPRKSEQRQERSDRRTSIIENLVFRFSCERCCLWRGAGQAFTLAEVLITLGIIGIVASLTIPQLITNHQKKITVSKLKKAYSLASQIIENDEISVLDWNWDNAETVLREHFVPKLQVTQVYPPVSTYKPMCETTKSYSWLGGVGVGAPFLDSTASIRLNDGTCIGLNPTDAKWEGQFSHYFFIDINGPEKPNVGGLDLFVFYINKNGHLRPYGDTFTDEKLHSEENVQACAYKRGTRSQGGFSCAAKIMRDGWEMKADYPWRNN